MLRAVVAVLAAVFVGAVIFAIVHRGDDRRVEATLPMAVPGTEASTVPSAPGVLPATTSTAAAVIWVHAAGAVRQPGLYRLAEGARVQDVLVAAGGLAADADPDRVNLAAVVHDGERVYLPHRDETSVPSVVAGVGGADPAAPGTTGPKPLVNVNRASAEELDALPGVGPATAAAIIEDRSKHGPFRSVDDLQRVPGIGPATLARLRPLVVV